MTRVSTAAYPEGARRSDFRHRAAFLRRIAQLILGVGLLAPAAGAAPAPELQGFVALSGGAFDAAPTFLDGGLGKLLAGELPDDASATTAFGEARLALDWEPAAGWRLLLHGVARSDPEARESGAASGLLEAYGERLFGFGEGHEIALRLGQFFLPSSRENVDPLWSSPYTLTLSALNSWIAEEVRPIGLDARYSKSFASEHRLTLAGTIFGGNDTSGTLIAWRGFALHARPTPTGRWIPLPDAANLDAGFPLQDPRGTKPFSDDLDDRPGYAGRARWDAPSGLAVLQATAFFNDGDRLLHGSQYSWRTDFRWLSAEVRLPAGFTAIGEWGTGFSEMGLAEVPGRSRSAVDIRFDTWFALLSWQRGALRATLRRDDFVVDDLDSTPGDENSEAGSAWTLAVMASFGERWRAGVELLDVDAERATAARLPGGATQLDGRSLLGELRYRF